MVVAFKICQGIFFPSPVSLRWESPKLEQWPDPQKQRFRNPKGKENRTRNTVLNSTKILRASLTAQNIVVFIHASARNHLAFSQSDRALSNSNPIAEVSLQYSCFIGDFPCELFSIDYLSMTLWTSNKSDKAVRVLSCSLVFSCRLKGKFYINSPNSIHWLVKAEQQIFSQYLHVCRFDTWQNIKFFE